jgi:hypothetical protein
VASDWPLLTGGRFSEVVVRTGLTALNLIKLVLDRLGLIRISVRRLG